MAGANHPANLDLHDVGDRELHYWISALLIARMIGPEKSDAKKIPRYLDLIGRGEAPERA